jgi:pyruvate dehydrogenase E2 component (dihydrolipoamide acetyltransferase)
MANDVLMPKMGYDMTEGKILRWLKKEGEPVERGQALAEIETDKASIEIEAFASGTLGQIIGKEGDTIPVGQKIAVILGEGESANGAAASAAAPPAEAKAQAAPAQDRPAQQDDRRETEDMGEGGPSQAESTIPNAGQRTLAGAQATDAIEAAPAGPDGRIKASPIARRIAQEHEIDLRRVQGSGPGGRIVREDVEAYLRQPQQQAQPQPAAAAPAAAPAPAAQAPAPAAAPTPGEGDRQVPLTRIRQTIARRMSESKATVPHFYVSAEVDMTEALAWRKRLNDAAQAEGYKITVNDMIVKACGMALVKFPNINASFGGDHMIMHDRIDISIAVALKEGLIAPVVRGVDKKSIGAVARDTNDLVSRAREGKLQPDEYSGGTFTVSNLGPFGIETFIAIVTAPQAAALAVGSSAQKAVVVDGQIVIRDRMNITISADHRVTDGAEAAQFVGEVRRLLENPLALLM